MIPVAVLLVVAFLALLWCVYRVELGWRVDAALDAADRQLSGGNGDLTHEQIATLLCLVASALPLRDHESARLLRNAASYRSRRRPAWFVALAREDASPRAVQLLDRLLRVLDNCRAPARVDLEVRS